MSVLNLIFDASLKTTIENITESPFTAQALRWFQANADMKTRNGLLEFLLHPHVRSYRCRAALGQPDQRHLFDILETLPFTPCGSAIPNVIGTYLLHGLSNGQQGEARGNDGPSSEWVSLRNVRSTTQNAFRADTNSGAEPRNSVAETSQFKSQHLVYCGQAAGVSHRGIQPALGLRFRSLRHYKEISKAKAGRASKAALYVHRRLANSDVVNVNFAVLSVFPFPEQSMKNVLHHFMYLLTLAETIDVILLDTLDARCSTVSLVNEPWHGPPRRLSQLLSRNWEGLNRALPIKQAVRSIGTLVASFSWSSQEIVALVNTIEKHEREVYTHGGPRKHAVQWDTLVELLHGQGICKTKAEVMGMYASLASSPGSGLITFRSSGWKLIWTRIHQVKEHLHQNGLIRDPQDDNDLFFHIPALENGLSTSWHILKLLKETGFLEWHHHIFFNKFFSRWLPRLLHRDIWENITGNVLPLHRGSPRPPD